MHHYTDIIHHYTDRSLVGLLGQYNSLGEYCGPHTASSVCLILVCSQVHFDHHPLFLRVTYRSLPFKIMVDTKLHIKWFKLFYKSFHKMNIVCQPPKK